MRLLRSSTVRIVLVLVVLLGGLFAVTDRWAVGVAEDEVAGRVQEELGLVSEPEVSIEGFPFLTQLLGGHLQEISIALREGYQARLDGETLTVDDLELVLTDLDIGDGYSSAVAGTAEGSGLIGYDELNRAYGELLDVGGNSLGVSFGYAAGGKLRITLEATMMGQSMELGDVTGEVVLVGNQIRFEVPDEEIPGSGGERLQQRFSEELDTERTISDLPAGLSLESLRPVEEGLVLTVSGTDVSLT